jgi:2-dehydro-3-deoxygluconokinase
MGQIVPYVDVIVGNEEDASDVFGISASGTSVEAGKLNIAAYTEVAQALAARFPKASKIAITLRESYSADHNNWGAMLYDVETEKSYLAPLAADGSYCSYRIENIVDRIGGGDSFSAGLIYALNTPEYSEPQKALAFAVAASCLKHSIYGDYNRVSVSEVASLMSGNASGRVMR